jgi:catechol 2,3-dioxygenase-like lactoylglutathione lyase family enzyme
VSAAAWAGIIVAELDRSLVWYTTNLACSVAEREPSWAKLGFANGSVIELFQGDRDDVATTFPSYGGDPGPPVMPGYAVDAPEELAEQHCLEVARALPGWVVVVAPDQLRLVLISSEVGRGRGLVDFRFVSTAGRAQHEFLTRLAIDGPEVVDGDVAVVPVVRGLRDAELTDPDGTTIMVVRAGTVAAS